MLTPPVVTSASQEFPASCIVFSIDDSLSGISPKSTVSKPSLSRKARRENLFESLICAAVKAGFLLSIHLL